jgi:hypothetical protein
MHASEGVPAACAHQSEKSSVGFDMKKSSPSIQIPALRGDVGGACKSDIPSRFVASKRSQGVDVQRYCFKDRHAVRFLDAVAN